MTFKKPSLVLLVGCLLVISAGYSVHTHSKTATVQKKTDTPTVKEKKTVQASSSLHTLQSPLDAIVANYASQNISIAITNVKTNETLTSGSQEAFTAASTTKVVTAICMLQAIQKGEFALGDVIDGLTIKEHIETMIINSNNESWHVFRDQLLGDTVYQTCADNLGADGFTVTNNTATTTSMVKVLVSLYNGKALNSADTSYLLNLLANTTENSMLPQAVEQAGLDTTSPVYHKYGYLYSNVHDVGLITINDTTYAIAIYTNNPDFSSFTSQTNIVADIAKQILLLLP